MQARNDLTFGDLPTEIRLLIWEFCIPKGRLIKVKAWAYERPFDSYRFRLETEQDRSLPILFSICRETRAIAQKTFVVGMKHFRDTEKLYWDPKSDFFYLNLRTFRVRNPVYHRVQNLHDSFHLAQNLALRLCPIVFFSLTRGTCVEWLHGFKSLTVLRLIIEPLEGLRGWNWTTLGFHLVQYPSDTENLAEIFVGNTLHSVSGKPEPTLDDLRSSYVQQAVAEKFEQYRAAYNLDWAPPAVEVYYMPEVGSSSTCSF